MLPASSRISAVIYSKTAAEKTAAVPPTRSVAVDLYLIIRWIRPTGNYKPALIDLFLGADLEDILPLPFPFPLALLIGLRM